MLPPREKIASGAESGHATCWTASTSARDGIHSAEVGGVAARAHLGAATFAGTPRAVAADCGGRRDGPPGLGSARTHRRRAMRVQAWRLLQRACTNFTASGTMESVATQTGPGPDEDVNDYMYGLMQRLGGFTCWVPMDLLLLEVPHTVCVVRNSLEEWCFLQVLVRHPTNEWYRFAAGLSREQSEEDDGLSFVESEQSCSGGNGSGSMKDEEKRRYDSIGDDSDEEALLVETGSGGKGSGETDPTTSEQLTAARAAAGPIDYSRFDSIQADSDEETLTEARGSGNAGRENG